MVIDQSFKMIYLMNKTIDLLNDYTIRIDIAHLTKSQEKAPENQFYH